MDSEKPTEAMQPGEQPASVPSAPAPEIQPTVTPPSQPEATAGETPASSAPAQQADETPGSMTVATPTEPQLLPTAPQAGPVVMGTAGSPTVLEGFSPEGQPGVISPKKKFVKTLLIAIAALAVLGGGSAAAYFGVVVPNKPENVLQAAFMNTLNQKHATFTGTFHEAPASGTGVAVKSAFSGQADAEKKAIETHMNITVSGVDFSLDARYVGKDLYFKLGDLKTIESLLNGIDPAYGAMAQSFESQVSNKWIKVDSTLLDSAGVSCVMDTNMTLSDSDRQLIETQYKQHPFTTIQSTASDTVNGKKVEKFVLSVDDDRMAQFADGLNSLGMAKALKGCDKNGGSTSFSSPADHDKTPLTVWVDKGSKQIVQISSSSTAKDAKKDNMKADATVTLDYSKPVSISAPASSTPLMQLLGEAGATSPGSSFPVR